MRIAMIGQKGFELGEKGGGIESHVSELARQLVSRGHEVVVYGRKKYGTDGAKGTGVKVKFVWTWYRKNVETIIHVFLCTLHALFQSYDILHYHGVGPATLAWIPRLLKPRVRVVVTFHSQDRFHKKWGWFARAYLWFGEWAACWFAHATIAVSHVLQVHARTAMHRQIVYIPNGAVVQHISATDRLREFGLEPKQYVLSVSRLVPHKRQDLLIEAWLQTHQPGKLVIVGAPAYTVAYERRLKNLAHGNPNVVFLGHQTGEALRQLFAHAYLFVQPSESEGLPVVVLESMSFGTPVLVSDIPENLEAMHRSGFSFRNKDVADLGEKLRQLMNHPEVVQSAAKQVQDTIQRYFNWSMIAAHTEEVYRSVRH